MTAARMMEYRITQQILQRRQGPVSRLPARAIAERIITTAAVTVALVLTGSYLQELLWVLLAGGAVLTLGTSKS